MLSKHNIIGVREHHRTLFSRAFANGAGNAMDASLIAHRPLEKSMKERLEQLVSEWTNAATLQHRHKLAAEYLQLLKLLRTTQ